MKVLIVDYELGNLASVKNIFKSINVDVIVSNKVREIKNSNLIVLPGVGNFSSAVKNLKKKKIFNFLKFQIKKGKPTLGICLGMQLLFKSSEEGEKGQEGFGIFKYRIKKMKKFNIGWHKIISKKKNFLFKDLNKKLFYFNHSYGLLENTSVSKFYVSNHSPLSSIVKKKNIIGVQFHPEKSQDSGEEFINLVLKTLNILKNE